MMSLHFGCRKEIILTLEPEVKLAYTKVINGM